MSDRFLLSSDCPKVLRIYALLSTSHWPEVWSCAKCYTEKREIRWCNVPTVQSTRVWCVHRCRLTGGKGKRTYNKNYKSLLFNLILLIKHVGKNTLRQNNKRRWAEWHGLLVVTWMAENVWSVINSVAAWIQRWPHDLGVVIVKILIWVKAESSNLLLLL